MSHHCFRLFMLILLGAGVAACSTTDKAATNTGNTSSTQTAEDTSNLEDLYWARIDSAKMSFTEADANFMIGMIGHHAQALVMSRLAPKNDASPQIQTLAARIINAQKDEIASMQTWLRDRDQPVPEIHIEGINLMIHGVDKHKHHMDHTTMPGMLSPQQLENLANTTGDAFDQLFLKYMIEHHSGAVTMVQKLFNTDGAALDDQAFRLASDIQADQITEIERMKLMLANMRES
ncbi:DUF305 domain-containing protein [Gracilimonas mengyeensis]|uniref:Uncharacterized conserved protein, DUF305 family n=1 Tax=Gracilimonas mengyeensis TaxID=1302730 RepID=A0A521EL36_9BACT|nr:DUF305 domain-containing protein [Gracilimonas mengyeensis]SMO84626.1 Uncharacterized conserved protein, DUF305 family [Gracilimonas mengyeensis]